LPPDAANAKWAHHESGTLLLMSPRLPGKRRKQMDKASKLDELIDDAEELLTNLTDAHDPDIQRLRDRVDDAIHAARRAIGRAEDDVALKLRDLAQTADDYVHDHPWRAVLTCAVVAGAIGFIAGSAARRPKRE